MAWVMDGELLAIEVAECFVVKSRSESDSNNRMAADLGGGESPLSGGTTGVGHGHFVDENQPRSRRKEEFFFITSEAGILLKIKEA